MDMKQLIQEIGTSVQEAHNAVDAFAMQRFFEDYFEENASNGSADAYSPKMLKLELPAAEGQGGKCMQIPVAALVQQQSLRLDTVKIRMNMCLTETKENKLRLTPENTALDAESEEDSHVGMLELTLKCGDAAEGIARIESLLHSQL